MIDYATRNRIKEAATYVDISHYQKHVGSVVQSSTDYCEVVPFPEMKKVVVSIKGSDSDMLDWFGKRGNFNYFDCNKDGIHDGFYNGWTSIRPGIFEELRIVTKKYEIQTIEIVGYSRGCGIALAGVKDFCFEFQAFKIKANLFGCPSVFNKNNEFAKWCHNGYWLDILRITNSWDIVVTSKLYNEVGLYPVGKEFKLRKPWFHRLPWFKVLDHRWPESYKKAIAKL